MRRFDMKSDWDVRAGEDAHKAIACNDAQNEAAFRASGERMYISCWKACRKFSRDARAFWRSAAEPVASGTADCDFDNVFGVDVSGEMVRRGQVNGPLDLAASATSSNRRSRQTAFPG